MITFTADPAQIAGLVTVPDDYALDLPHRSVKREGATVLTWVKERSTGPSRKQ